MEAFNKFDQWWLGKSDITVRTDHQPLVSIFQKDLTAAPKRLQEMMLFLQRYNFRVSYNRGSFLHLANTQSRAPLQEHDTRSDNNDTFQIFRTHVFHVNQASLTLTDSTLDWLRKATASCPDMQLLEHRIIHALPPTKQHLPSPLQPLWNFRDELSVADGLLLKSSRAFVPTSLRANMLHKIH